MTLDLTDHEKLLMAFIEEQKEKGISVDFFKNTYRLKDAWGSIVYDENEDDVKVSDLKLTN